MDAVQEVVMRRIGLKFMESLWPLHKLGLISLDELNAMGRLAAGADQGKES